jgi:hypothetical protein
VSFREVSCDNMNWVQVERKSVGFFLKIFRFREITLLADRSVCKSVHHAAMRPFMNPSIRLPFHLASNSESYLINQLVYSVCFIRL